MDLSCEVALGRRDLIPIEALRHRVDHLNQHLPLVLEHAELYFARGTVCLRVGGASEGKSRQQQGSAMHGHVWFGEGRGMKDVLREKSPR